MQPRFDLGAVTRRVQASFHEHGASWSAHTDRYAIDARVDEFSLSPLAPAASAAGRRETSVRFATHSLRRGSSELRATPGTVHIGGDGSLRSEHEGYAETIENRADGVEQAWHFDRAPEGRGDVEVRIAVTGAHYVDASDGGLRFVSDDETAAAVRYGVATWIDATGAANRIPVRWDGHDVVVSVPDDVVTRSTFPATLDPTISPEFAIDTPTAPGAASRGQRDPAIASNGTMFLVAWTDQRASARGDLWAARVDGATGTVLDAIGFAVSTAPDVQQMVDVAFDGTDFVVVWSDSRRGLGQYDVYAARVTTSGSVRDPDGVLLSSGAVQAQHPAIECDGTACLVAWNQQSNIVGARISNAGTVLDPGGVPLVSTPTFGEGAPSVAFDGTEYLLTWTQYTDSTNADIYAARFGTDAARIDVVGIPVGAATGNQTASNVAFDGTRFLVAWTDHRGLNDDVYAARVATDGTVLDPNGFAVTTASGDQSAPQVASDGAGFFVTFDNTTADDVYGARIRDDGTVLDPNGFLVDADLDSFGVPMVAFAGGNYLVVWEDRPISPSNIAAARITPSGTILDPTGFVVSTGLASETTPVVAFDGTNYFVAYDVSRDGDQSYDVYVTRIGPTGAIIDAAPIVLAATAADERVGGIAFDGTNLLVAWSEKTPTTTGRVRAARVSRAGVVLDAPALTLPSANPSPPAVGYNGTNYLVAWSENRGTTGIDVVGARVSTAGVIADATGLVINNGTGDQTGVVVAGSPTRFFVFWSDGDIHAAYVLSTGPPSGAITVCGATDSQFGISAAWDGTNYLVAWGDRRNGSNYDVYAGRLSTSLTPLDGSGFVVSSGASDQRGPSVAFDGTNFVVIWDDQSGSIDAVVGTRVSRTGLTLDTPGATIATDPTGVFESAITRGSGAGLLVAYRHSDGSTAYQDRVFGRIADFTVAPPGTPCTLAAQCQSNFCVDGVCCETSCGGGVGTDCMACSVANGAVMDGRCGTSVAGTLCRRSSSPCDIAEVCDGTSTTCPANVVAVAGTVCRPAAGPCDFAETCSGTSSSCPTDAFRTAVTVCRPAVGPCDVTDTCSGTSAACPTDRVATNGTPCRPVAGPCDVAEACDGSAPNCPVDTFLPSTTTCRGVAGPCDVAEQCAGDAAACPFDAKVSAGVICRSATGPCDVAETCTGSAVACPPDVLSPSTTLCRAETGLCDVAEYCTGSNGFCPADIVRPAGSTCRAIANVCDVAESCDGFSGSCPVDAFAPSFTVCRSSIGLCDVTENCTGSSANCPADAFAPIGVECRPAAGACDLAEECTGTSGVCPSNSFAPPSTECRPAIDLCDVPETCTGSSGACPPNGYAAASTVCRTARNACDVEETCSGSGASCPADSIRPDGTACGDALACNGSETCLAGACGAGVSPCDDGDPCTFDGCTEPGTCTHSPMCTVDAGTTDAGADDSGAADAESDAADVADALDVLTEAGSDVETVDATPADGAAVDAPNVDTGTVDAEYADRSLAEAGDAGDAGVATMPRGCACRTTPGRGTPNRFGWWAIAALLLALPSRASRRARRKARDGAVSTPRRGSSHRDA